MKCIFTSNKLLLLCWFKFLLLLSNSLQNRITLLLVLKLFQSTKLTPGILFFLLHHDVFFSSVPLFFKIFFFFNFITLISRFYCICFFCPPFFSIYIYFLNFITLISRFYFPKSLLLYFYYFFFLKTPTIKSVL